MFYCRDRGLYRTKENPIAVRRKRDDSTKVKNFVVRATEVLFGHKLNPTQAQKLAEYLVQELQAMVATTARVMEFTDTLKFIFSELIKPVPTLGYEEQPAKTPKKKRKNASSRRTRTRR